MAHLHDAQRNPPLEALTTTLIFAGGRADAHVARIEDLTLPAPSARECAEAPAKPELRTGWLARRGLARRAVARRLGCDAADVVIAHEAAGAPYIAAPDCALHISLSGRQDLVAVALAERPVGVDIEPVGARFEHPLNVMHPAERAALAALPDDETHDYFLRLWTAKEAYLKALKTGFGREPSEIEIRLGPPARIDGAIHVGRRDDIVILDRDVVAPVATAFVQRLLYMGRPLAFGCIVLG
jgi:4'-phosphopantetheinyl transferase